MCAIGDRIDVISVLTPSGTHCQNVLEFARADGRWSSKRWRCV
jgi:hypothetical protein